MKTLFFLFMLPVVGASAHAEQAALQQTAHTVPDSLDGKQMVLTFCVAEETKAQRGELPGMWQACARSPMALQFPVGGGNSYTYQRHEQTPDTPWPPVTVTYVPEESCILITGNDMYVKLALSFSSSSHGKADIEWRGEDGTWYARGADFTISATSSTAGLLTMPQAEACDGAIQSVDDGLADLVRELEQRSYKTAVERLYQKRLLTVLPQIMEGAPVDNIISNANGTTALHNACGLSHVELVQWLVDHGANLNAKTAKGATVDDCVGGPNAKAIRAILNKARRTK